MRYLLLLVSCVAWGQAWYPATPNLDIAGTANPTITLNTTGQIYSVCGYVWTPSAASKNIDKVGTLFASVSKGGGSALTLSLQDVSTAAGPPVRPDGTPDQTAALSNASISAAFIMSPSLSAQRSVSYGSLLCVAIEFDGAGRLGSDSFGIAANPRSSTNVIGMPNTVLFTGGSWASQNRMPLVVFEFSDGTWGTLDGSTPMSAANTTVAYNSGSASDEYALKFSPPVNGTIDAVQVALAAASGANFDIVLYSGTTALATTSIDYHYWDGSSVFGGAQIPITPTTVSAGTTYYISVKPTTTNNVTLNNYVMSSANYWNTQPQTWIRSSRVDGGAWSDATTTRPSILFRFTPSAGGSSAGGAYVVAQ